MLKFRLKGLVHPGRVNLYKIGTVELANISDELALRIWKEGCPYLEPLPECRAELFPDEIPIRVKPILNQEGSVNPPAQKPEKGTRKKPRVQ